jgi:putative oxidoreductase
MKLLTDDIGKLILRLTLGILLLLHGVAKVVNPESIAGIGKGLAANGLPEFVAYGVYVGEIVAPLMMIVGIFTRVSGVITVVNMTFAIWLVHAHQLAMLTKQGGWQLELQGFYLFCGLALAFLGSGKIAARPD